MNAATSEQLLRQIRNRLTLACIALVVVALFAIVPELHQLPLFARIVAVGVPVLVGWYVQWLRTMSSIRPASATQSSATP